MSLKTKIADLKDLFVSRMNGLYASKAEDSNVLHKTGDEVKASGSLRLNATYTISDDLKMGRIIFPKGGQIGTLGSDNNVGAMRITVPTVSGIVDFTIIVNIHSLNNSNDTRAIISGRTGNDTWGWQSAFMLTNQSEDYTVRYGHANGNYYVYIGELTKDWKSFTATIESVYTRSYGTNTVQGSLEGWEIAVVQSFDTISGTISNTFPWGDWTKLKGKPNNLALLTDIPSLSGYALESWVSQQIADLVDSSPAALDTLNEIATALGNDPNFSTTILNLLAGKLNKAGDEMTGDLSVIGSVSAKNSGNAAAYTINDNGNFPRATFVVAGDGSITNAGFWVVPDSDTNTPTFIEVMDQKTTSSTTNRLMLKISDVAELFSSSGNGNGTGKDLNIYTIPNTNQLYLKNNGNVGIGKNNPATKLDVNGVITATGGNSTQWNAKKDGFTVLPVSEGGTGKTSIGEGKVLVGNASGGFDEVGFAGQMLTTTVDITSTMIYDALNNPVDLIAAPGAGKGIDVIRFVILYKHNGTYYPDGDYQIGYASNRSLYFEKFEKYNTDGYVESVIPIDGQIIPNTKVVFRLPTSNSVPTAGNGDLKIKIYYRIESF